MVGLTICIGCVRGQGMDSIHVYARLASGGHTSASAHAQAWRLHREGAPHRSVVGNELGLVAQALAGYRPVRHGYGAIPDLAHLAMVFHKGRPVAFGVTSDLGCVINLTARREYRIDGMAEHMRVRVLLGRLLLQGSEGPR